MRKLEEKLNGKNWTTGYKLGYLGQSLTRNLVKIFLTLMETRLVASLSKKMFLIVLAAKMRAWTMKMMSLHHPWTFHKIGLAFETEGGNTCPICKIS